MKCRKAYAIIPVGENDRSAHVAQQKAPEVATPGLFYSVLGGWLNPKAGYQLFFSVQPFADVVGKQSNQEQVRAEQNRQRDAEQNRKLISELKQSVELLKNSNELLQDAISGEIGSLKDEVKENTVQEVRKALQANIEAIQRATKLLEKQSDTLTSVMKQKIRELEESKNSFFRYEGLKLYLFWGGMVCNILVFLMLLYGMISK